MQNVAFLLLFSTVLLCSCNTSIHRNSTERTTITDSTDSFPDVSAAVAAGGYKLVIKDGEGSQAFSSKSVAKSEAYYGSHPDSIRFKNVPLKEALAALLDLDTAYIKSNKVDSLKQRIDLSFKSKHADSKNRFIAIDGLSKHYGFALEKTGGSAWDLVVEDGSKLDDRVVDKANEETFTTSDDGNSKSISIKKCKLGSLAQGINRLFPIKVTDKTDDSRHFNLDISAKDFKDLQTTLQKYGMALKRPENANYSSFVRFKN